MVGRKLAMVLSEAVLYAWPVVELALDANKKACNEKNMRNMHATTTPPDKGQKSGSAPSGATGGLAGCRGLRAAVATRHRPP